MPLGAQLQNAHVIIHKLEQPHRFDYALQCACGFQHHGFASQNTSKGDEVEDMRAAARTHLVNRHGVPPADVAKYFEVQDFTHPGGITHAQAKLHPEYKAGGVPIPQVQTGGVTK